jgi:hypothetical protein
MAFKYVAGFSAALLLASCGSVTSHPDGSAGDGGSSAGAGGNVATGGNAGGGAGGKGGAGGLAATGGIAGGSAGGTSGAGGGGGVCTSGGACACYQDVSPVICTSGASCMNWGFESGAEGWGMDPSNPSLGVTNITVSSSHFHGGTHSLAVTAAIAAYSASDSRGISVAVPLCASSGTVNLAGYTLSAWVYFTVTAGAIPMNAANLIQGFFAAKDSPGGPVGTASTAIAVQQSTTNQWLHLQGSVNQVDATNYQLAINAEFPIADPGSEGFTGTMYLDDVQLLPP